MQTPYRQLSGFTHSSTSEIEEHKHSYMYVWIWNKERKEDNKKEDYNRMLKYWWLVMPICLHDDIIKWKNCLRYWPFVKGIHRWPVDFLHKGQWRRALSFLWWAHEHTVGQPIETPMIWDAIALIVTSLWCQRTVQLMVPLMMCYLTKPNKHWSSSYGYILM